MEGFYGVRRRAAYQVDDRSLAIYQIQYCVDAGSELPHPRLLLHEVEREDVRRNRALLTSEGKFLTFCNRPYIYAFTKKINNRENSSCLERIFW
jgi:hypothetical protein